VDPGTGLGPRGHPTGGARALRVAPARPATLASDVAPRHPYAGLPEATGQLRPRLLQRLDQVLGVRLGAVVAPAGAGKTTLMAQWARRAPVDVAWCTAEAEWDADRVVSGIGRALSSLQGEPAPVGDLASLLAAVDRHDSPLVVVLDDVHVVDRPDVVDVLQELLLRAGSHLHLLVGARRVPAFNLARTELSTLSVTADDLRLRPHETGALFREQYGVTLSPAEADRLTHHSEGWVAGLHLFHQSLVRLPVTERAAALESLDGRVRYARDYLSREVLDRLPVQLARFLHHTAVLETLTAHRCDALRDADDSWRRLVELEQLTTHVSSSDGGASFRVQGVLRHHLVTALRDERGDREVAALFRRAGAVLVDDGAPVEAVRALVQGHDWESLHEVLRTDGLAVVVDRSSHWLPALPPRVVDREPWLQVAQAMRALRDGDLTRALAQANRAAGGMTDTVGSAVCVAIAHFARVWTTAHTAPSATWTEQLRTALQQPRRPHPTDRAGRPSEILVQGVHRMLVGDLDGARRQLSRCRPGSSDPAASVCLRLLLSCLDPEEPAALEALADYALEFGLPWLARIARALAAAPAYVDAAGVPPGDPLRQAVLDAEQRDDRWAAAVLTGIRATALLRAGAPDIAELEDLVARLRELDAPALEAWARAGLALAAAAADLPDAVREAESAEGFAHSCGIPGALAVAHAARARCRDDRRELLDLAEEEAADLGLGTRPWHWTTPPPAVRPAEPATARRRATAPPPVEIRCFGGFALAVDGEPVSLRRVRPRARQALRMLALHAGRAVHRDQLVDALWRELDPEAATHNLHVAVSSLRATLEPGAPRGRSRLVVRESTGYTLALPSGSRCDVLDFDERVTAADTLRARRDTAGALAALEQALALYTGEVLPEEGPAEWVIGPRDQYRLRASAAAGLVGELHLADGDAHAAAEAALRSIEIDPCRDPSWRLLISAYDAAGDLAAAERARRSYAEVLQQLGVVADSASALVPRLRSAGRL